MQLSPPSVGGGLVQVLVLVLVPFLQVVEHSLQVDQLAQLPFTNDKILSYHSIDQIPKWIIIQFHIITPQSQVFLFYYLQKIV